MKKEKKIAAELRGETARERLLWAARNSAEEVLGRFGTTSEGLTEERVLLSRETYGENTVSQGRKNSVFKRIFAAFVNPFTAILAALALVSAVTDIILAAPGERNYVTVVVIAAMVLVSGGLRFIQETRSGNAAAKLSQMIRTTACVERAGTGKAEIP
ncbi:MAG TPA: magnesium-translocating P-type ATPase, partial [Candidatus Scatosoma pullistercoris]|nr:magnesium-translocating P-type ATPase [Candidatus Scatosoma pullistercoris]